MTARQTDLLKKRRLLELKVGECLFPTLPRHGLLSLFRGPKLFFFERTPLHLQSLARSSCLGRFDAVSKLKGISQMKCQSLCV